MHDRKGEGDMEYLFDKQVEPGELIEVADGVLWLTMPLPFELDHILISKPKSFSNRSLCSDSCINQVNSSKNFLTSHSSKFSLFFVRKFVIARPPSLLVTI